MYISRERAMALSYVEAAKSPDPSTQNGAVLLGIDGDVIGLGYNDFPRGTDTNYWNGDKAAKYARVCHAEVSAILSAARNGQITEGSTLVCGWAACENCAKYMVLAGVRSLVRHPYDLSTTNDSWRASCDIGDEILRAGSVKIVEIDPSFITLRRDGKPWRAGA